MVAVRSARAAPRGHDRLSEPRAPLWASGLASQPRPADDDYFEVPSPARADPAPEEASGDGLGVAVALMAVVLFLLWGTILTRGSDYTRQTVASRWNDIPMSCDTRRFERPDQAVELFTCRAVGGRLPPGVYRSPRSLWSSDITRQDARGDVLRITRGGVLSGIAVY